VLPWVRDHPVLVQVLVLVLVLVLDQSNSHDAVA